MIRDFGKKRYTLFGAFAKKSDATSELEAARESGMFYARMTKDPDYTKNLPHHIYRVWIRNKKLGGKKK